MTTTVDKGGIPEADRAPARDKGGPTIVVLPFATDRPEHASVAEGIAETLSGALGRTGELTVLAHATARAMAARGAEPGVVAEATGADYLLTGRIRDAGSRLRVTAELSELATGRALWSACHEGASDDPFALEDSVTEAVIGRLLPRIRKEEIARAHARPTESLAARDLVLQAYPHLWTHRAEDNAEALALLNQALALDPGFGRAAALAAWAHAQRVVYLWGGSEDDRAAAQRLVAAAAVHGRDDPTTLAAMAAARTLLEGAFTEARLLAERALAIDPTHAWALSRLGYTHLYAGEVEPAIAAFEKSIRLSPVDPMVFNNLMGIADAHFYAGRSAEAVAWAERALAENPAMTWAYRELAVYLADAGELEGARAALSRFVETRPGVSLHDVERNLAPLRPWFGDRYRAALRQVWPGARNAPAVARPLEASMRREDEENAWHLVFDGVAVTLPDLKGLHDLARLLARPGKEFHCLDLAGRSDADRGAAVLDERGRLEVSQRIRELQEELAEAEDMHDIGRAESLRGDLDHLVDALSRALGIGGRLRRVGDLAERARSTVTWRIRHAIRRIGKAHPGLQRHLENSIRTGSFCSYQPERPCRWEIVT
ncbi:tetratricopeptide repeat protein [Halomonas maura]|uniref:tetratricopeptide repeat protein n=1 Tax=Halomonas maura TaxID=117606 RepID=UPI0025B42F61|nr:tetratricopeptide repeat protein [Halomonas maura]MDN3556954.1 tetratricopeptide repeat protein [Halomonas maura]